MKDLRISPPVMVLVFGCLLLAINMGVRQTMGLFVEPMTAAHGWSREAFSFAIGLQNLLWGASQPFAAAIAERYGVARTLLIGATLYALGLLLMAQSESVLALNLSAGMLVGLGISGTAFPIVFGAVARTVSAERRSLALGLAGAGASFGQFIFTPFTQFIIDDSGWFIALMVLAAFCAAMVPMSRALKGRTNANGNETQTLGAALVEARGHSGYLFLTVGFFVCGFQVVFIAVHIIPYVTQLNMSPMIGASALGLVGLFNIFGSLGAGALGGRYRKKHLLSYLYLTRSAVILVFILGPKTEISVLIFGAIIGLLWLSTVPLTSALIAQIFGPRYLGTLFGITFFSHQVGSFLGAWLGGLVFDMTGSYNLMWQATIVLGVVAAALHWPIRDAPVVRLATSKV